MGEIWRRIWYLLNRSRLDRELREEMAAHVAMKGDTGPAFGNELRLRERATDEWGWGWLDRLAQDLRFALRLLMRSPAFTASATAVLAFGVGLNLAVFQVLDATALSWLPVRAPERLVHVLRRSPTSTSTALSYPAFDFYRRSSSLSAALGIVDAEVALGEDRLPHVPVEFVTSNYFADLGAGPLIGRVLDARDDRPDAEASIVLSESIWKIRFGGQASIVGSTVRVNDRPFVVAGVVAATFVGPESRGVAWIPVTQHPLAFSGSTLLSDPSVSPVRFYAWFREGLSREGAEAELKPLVAALRQAQPAHVWEEWLALRPAGRFIALEQMHGAGMALVAALVVLVLIAACMNLGLLVLARSLSREREFAIRLSVGATRGRIVRQLVTEYLVLAALGGAAGCAVSAGATRIMLVLIGVPSGITPHFGGRVVAVAAALAVVSLLLFGFTPAMQALKPAPTRLRFRNVLVALQVGAACVLLIVASLLVRGVTRVTTVPLGFDYENTVLVEPALDSYGIRSGAADAYWRDLDSRVRRLGAVADAALVTLPPFGNRVDVNGKGTLSYRVTPSYFQTMRIPIVRGRNFSAGERGVVILSGALVRREWPGEDPLGKPYNGATVIGVAGDARTVRIGDGSSTEAYTPIGTPHLAEAVMVVRADARPDSVATAISSVAREIDSRVTPHVTLLRDNLNARLEGPRQAAMLIAVLGACALALAVTALAGVISFTVSQRVREIGIRLALGAGSWNIVRAIGRQFAWPTVAGLLGGAACASLLATVLSSELFGVSPIDPTTYGGVALVFVLVTALTALPSLRRALRIDPMTALRHD
jgi:predicted permease